MRVNKIIRPSIKFAYVQQRKKTMPNICYDSSKVVYKLMQQQQQQQQQEIDVCKNRKSIYLSVRGMGFSSCFLSLQYYFFVKKT